MGKSTDSSADSGPTLRPVTLETRERDCTRLAAAETLQAINVQQPTCETSKEGLQGYREGYTMVFTLNRLR